MNLRELEAKWREQARQDKADSSGAIRQREIALLVTSGTYKVCADELASTLRTMTCSTCKHGRGMSGPEAMNDEPRCCHPSEAHPLHWQETSPSFGCMDWAASPPLEETK